MGSGARRGHGLRDAARGGAEEGSARAARAAAPPGGGPRGARGPLHRLAGARREPVRLGVRAGVGARAEGGADPGALLRAHGGSRHALRPLRRQLRGPHRPPHPAAHLRAHRHPPPHAAGHGLRLRPGGAGARHPRGARRPALRAQLQPLPLRWPAALPGDAGARARSLLPPGGRGALALPGGHAGAGPRWREAGGAGGRAGGERSRHHPGGCPPLRGDAGIRAAPGAHLGRARHRRRARAPPHRGLARASPGWPRCDSG